MNWMTFIIIANLLLGLVNSREIPLTKGSVEEITLKANETIKLIYKESDKVDPNDAFWTFEAHSQDNADQIFLSLDEKAMHHPMVQVGNHQGLIFHPQADDNVTKTPFAFLSNKRRDRVSLQFHVVKVKSRQVTVT